MKRIVAMWVVLKMTAVWAGGLGVESDGDFVVAWPAVEKVQVERQDHNPQIDCESVLDKVKRNRQGIERCMDGGSQPTTFCRLLRGDLQRALLGIETSSPGAVAAGAVQRWALKPSRVDMPTVSELTTVARDAGVSLDQVLVGTAHSVAVTRADLILGDSSFSSLLAKARVLEIQPAIQSVNGSTTVFETNNRLTACELMSGSIQMQSTVQVEYRYSIVSSPEQMHALWDVSVALQSIQNNAIAEWQKYVLAGFTLADSLLGDGEEVTQERILKLSGLLLATQSGRFLPVAFRNPFHLGRLLDGKEKSLLKEMVVGGEAL